MSPRPWHRIVLALALILCTAAVAGALEIPLTKRGGVFTMPVRINNVVTLDFVLDSGASEVVVPADVALTLVRTGTIKKTDRLPEKTYRLANGSLVKGPRFVLRLVEVGGRRIENVPAAITPVGSPLLIGQSFLERLGMWSLDSRRKMLILPDPDRPKPKPRRAVRLKKSPVSLDPARHGDLPEDWQILRKLAAKHLAQDDPTNAMPYLEKALKIQEETLGARDSRVPETVGMLIRVYEQLGKSKEAESLNNWADSVWGGQ